MPSPLLHVEQAVLPIALGHITVLQVAYMLLCFTCSNICQLFDETPLKRLWSTYTTLLRLQAAITRAGGWRLKQKVLVASTRV